MIQEGLTMPTAASVTTGKMVALLIVYMALTSFVMFPPVTKMVQIFRMLVPSVTRMRVALTVNETLYELQYSHYSKKKMPQRIPPPLAS